MINGKRVLALIPARGGSKGIPHKNIIDLYGKPLLAYSIEAAKKSKYVDEIFVSTDDVKIRDVAIEYGAIADALRPGELATDSATTISTVYYVVQKFKRAGNPYDILLLLQPTSPLRTAEDIDAAIETFANYNYEALVSVSPVSDHPILIRSVGDDGRLSKLLNCSSTCRRQDMPPFYRVNGAIYINLCEELTATTSLNDNPVSYVMTAEHSIDIDDISDLLVAEYYLKNEEGKK